MEKMNQVSVSEFFAKTNEERYDDAVAMVEKYNRLVDICNDSAERMAELVVERDDLTERHNVYTSALNKDIAAKAAKIELMQKELDGRKAGYAALKARFDSKNDEIENLKKELDARGEEIKKLNKCIMNKNESINTANDAIVNLRKEIGAHEEENKKLENRISELRKERDKHMARVNDLRMELDCVKASKEKHEEAVRDEVHELSEDAKYWKEAFEAQSVNLADKVKENTYLKKELEQTCTAKELDLKGHQRRGMSLVNALADKNDEIKKLKESIEEWKNQERIRTNQLRATERKVEELWKEIEKFTKGEDDDYGKSGFKRYIEHLIEEEERAVPERFKERLNEEITAIFTKEEETEVEVDKSKNYGPIPESARRAAKGRYPWGAKVNDIPCGEDAIE